MGINYKELCKHSANAIRAYSGVSTIQNKYVCKLLIVGAGAGGCSVAWRLSKKFKNNELIVLEPSQVHYNQPQFTLIAAGIKKFRDTYTCRPTASLLPPNGLWLKDSAADFDPCNNIVYTKAGDKVTYDFMVVALGIENDYDQIPGLEEALNSPLAPVTTIYDPDHCQKTQRLIKAFNGGLAVFTRPLRGGKCLGAAHCITYLADDYWRKHKIRDRANITYVTGDDVTYRVPKYAAALNRIAEERRVVFNYNMELAEVTSRGAVFVDKTKGGCTTLPYNFLHVTPPMRAPPCLTRCEELSTEGYLDVDKWTLRHRRYKNVFGIGDCVDTPNSKTAAAVAQQSPVVAKNLSSTMAGEEPTAKYNGYGACPILTSYNTGILTEFIYDNQVWETFAFDQSKERCFLYYLKKDIMPYIYWNKLLKGKWGGPSTIRRIINPFGR